MNFTIAKDSFIKVLQRIQGIVEKRNTMPILANVHMEASGGKVTIMATDLEVFIKDSAGAQVESEGSVTVNARKMFEIVKELPGDQVDVSTGKEDKVEIKSGKARFNIMGLPAKDFPVFPEFDQGSVQPIDRDTLAEMIDKTSFAVSTDETRYNINGFLLEKDDSKIRMVATDGHRLAVIEKPDGGLPGGGKQSVLMPRKGVMEMRKLLEEDEGEVTLGIDHKNAVMQKGDTVINVRLLEGEFPDYNKVVPKDNTREITAGRAELLSSLKRVSILSTDKIKGVRFSFNNDGLTLSSSSPDIGDATEEVEVGFDGGEELAMAFNAKYFMDMLEAVTDEKIRLFLKDSLSSALLRPDGTDDYSYIIMPMRL